MVVLNLFFKESLKQIIAEAVLGNTEAVIEHAKILVKKVDNAKERLSKSRVTVQVRIYLSRPEQVSKLLTIFIVSAPTNKAQSNF